MIDGWLVREMLICLHSLLWMPLMAMMMMIMMMMTIKFKLNLSAAAV